MVVVVAARRTALNEGVVCVGVSLCLCGACACAHNSRVGKCRVQIAETDYKSKHCGGSSSSRADPLSPPPGRPACRPVPPGLAWQPGPDSGAAGRDRPMADPAQLTVPYTVRVAARWRRCGRGVTGGTTLSARRERARRPPGGSGARRRSVAPPARSGRIGLEPVARARSEGGGSRPASRSCAQAQPPPSLPFPPRAQQRAAAA